jgi:transposase
VHAATSSPAAHELLSRIGELFTLEADIRGRSPDERLKVRTEQSIPKLNTLKALFDSTLSKISGKSSLAQALRYSLSRWQSLTRYTTDGRLEISNNAAERAIRPLKLAFCWLRYRRRSCGHDLYDHRDGKDERSRARSLPPFHH